MSQLASVEAIFFAALEKGNPAERAAYLDQACNGDAELRRCVERMLNAQPDVGSFLEKPAADLAAAVTVPPNAALPPTEGPGGRIGPYKLLQQIGEGGMGVVYMAEQTAPVRRLVALKVVRAGLDSAQAVARFETERQALALMDHPNIAKVLDAGTTAEGRPYFVMELVKGVPITKFCDERRLTPRQRLELFVPVCQAVQHAHQKGVIHRDLKPSNVLVTLYDGNPVPKVIDFGIAKATGQKLTERTLFTAFGAVVGTPEYMSPEQAELNQLDIDTRSDIYSLGVLLYELLTGTTPLGRKRLDEGAILEVLRLVREEEPPKPSTRLSTSDALASVAANRNIEPAKLTRLVRGELDWIVMKTLEKDRNRRYETASGLAMDLLHYLNDEPVQAGPPGMGYRLRKCVKRHRAAIAGWVAVMLPLVVCLIFFGSLMTYFLHRTITDMGDVYADVQAELADEASEARQQLQFLKEKVLGAARPGGQNGGTTIRQALDAAEPQIATGFAEKPRLEAAMRDEFGRLYLRLGEPALAARQFERSLELRRRHQPDAWTTYNACSLLGGSLLARKKYAEAEPLLVQGYEGMKEREKSIPATAKALLTEAGGRLVELYDAWGRPAQAAAWRKKLDAPGGR